jgi:hypothetical protein
MSKKIHAKKPQDATLRNVRAARTRNTTLRDRVSRLERRVTRLAGRVAGLLGLRTDE